MPHSSPRSMMPGISLLLEILELVGTEEKSLDDNE
jgi:hypothetical protein